MAVTHRLFCACLCAIFPAILWGQSPGNEFVLMMFCDPVAGREAEFHSWWPGYIQSVAAVPGVTGAEDFRRAPVRLRDGAEPLPAHLAFFAISAPDFAAVIQDIGKRMKDGRILISPAVDTHATRDFSYHLEGVWTGNRPVTRGDVFLQTGLSNATAGQDAEYRRWF